MVSAGSAPDSGTLLVLAPPGAAPEGLVAGLGERGHAMGVVTTAPEALRRVATEHCAGAIVSGALADPRPAEAIGALRVLSPSLPLLLLADSGGVPAIVAALEAGADGFVSPADASAEVVEALLARLAEVRRPQREVAAPDAPSGLAEEVRRAAHEMNQPLTVIFGLVDVLLLDAPEESAVRADLLTLQREAERLRMLARSLVRLGAAARPEEHPGA